MRRFGLKKIDLYIIKKFLTTFFYAIGLIIMVVIIFDLSEKMDEFLEHKVALKSIIVDYYLNFLPHFVVLFSSLFTFISVIYFTSRMAYNSEIIAMLSSGLSLRRLMVPYFISAIIIATFAFTMENFLMPQANKNRMEFETKYDINRASIEYLDKNIHRQIEPGLYIYFEHFWNVNQRGKNFSMERFVDGKLVSKLMAKKVKWDSTINKWVLQDYYIREINGLEERLITGHKLDTAIDIRPDDFERKITITETMTLTTLHDFIEEQKIQGNTNVVVFQLDQYRRYFSPVATFILTLIGLTLSMRKVRGGMGAQIGLGVLLSFSYILFSRFSSQFAIGEGLNPLLAIWIPNLIFIVIAFFLYRWAPK